MRAVGLSEETIVHPGAAGVLETLDVSVVMPCLNESATIGACVTKALQTWNALIFAQGNRGR
jgi:hypothetical protein